jgi:hypothetical protein
MAWTSIGVGGGLSGLAAAIGFAFLPLATGALGLALGAAYLASPSWRLRVIADASGLEVRDDKRSRFKLAWTDIVRVVASPTTKTCFVDGGAAERSLLVPGVGAPAPYQLTDRDELFATILERVTPDRLEIVESLERKTEATKPA